MKSLPKKPNLDFLKKEARKLRTHHQQRSDLCLNSIREFDTSFLNKSDTEIFNIKFSLNDAQRILAREYGYSSWATLKHFIQSLSAPLYNGVSDRDAYHNVITDSYDERSKNYDDSEWHRGLALETVDYAPPQKAHKVLDIATGTGSIAFYTADLVGPKGSVTAIDISKGMLAKCREKLADSKFNNLQFEYADAENLDFKPNSFDRIYCSSAFFWMSHPQAVLRHWLELLKPNGVLSFNAWPENSFVWGACRRKVLKKYGIDFTIHQATGTIQKCDQLLKLSGFEDIRIHEVKDGHYIPPDKISLSDIINDKDYAPGQYPHPVTDLPDEIKRKVAADIETETKKLITDKGLWHDMTMYYVHGRKPT